MIFHTPVMAPEIVAYLQLTVGVTEPHVSSLNI